MTENPSPAVGRAAVNAYLDSVELALIAADAPRIDRLQVLQDLESQIADMLAQQPTPLTEDSVRAVLDKLEPPSHFAATYGNGTRSNEATSPTPTTLSRFTGPPRLPRLRWPLVAALSCAILPIGCVILMPAAAADEEGPIALSLFLILVGLVLTPFALWKSFRQLRVCPDKAFDRGLVMKSTVVYAAIALTILVGFVTVATRGFALFPLGAAAFVYLQYLFLRRLWHRMDVALPPQPASSSNGVTNGHNTTSPISSAAPMPAM